MGLFDDLGNAFGGGGGRTDRTPKVQRRITRRGQNLAAAIEAALPQLVEAFAGNILPIDEALLKSAQATVPGFADLQRQVALGDAQTTRDIFTGDLPAFQQGARAVDTISREIDPEFYATRGSLASALQELLQPGLTGGERTEVERSLNRDAAKSGNLNNTSNLETVRNAITFGNAARDRFSQAASQVTAALPALRTGVSSPAGISATPSTQSPIGAPGAGLNVGGDLLSQLGGVQRLTTEARLTPQLSDFERVSGSLPDY